MKILSEGPPTGRFTVKLRHSLDSQDRGSESCTKVLQPHHQRKNVLLYLFVHLRARYRWNRKKPYSHSSAAYIEEIVNLRNLSLLCTLGSINPSRPGQTKCFGELNLQYNIYEDKKIHGRRKLVGVNGSSRKRPVLALITYYHSTWIVTMNLCLIGIWAFFAFQVKAVKL